MEISVTDAKVQLTDLVRRAENGEEIILTRYGRPVARIASFKRAPKAADKLALYQDIMRTARAKVVEADDAARSQDFLYGDDGLPA